MTLLSVLIGFALAWGARLLGDTLSRNAGRFTGERVIAPATARLVLSAAQGNLAFSGARRLAPLAALEVAGAIFMAIWSLAPVSGWQAIVPVAWFFFFALIATTDILCRWVPNFLVYPAALVAVGLHLLTGDLPILQGVIGGGLAYGVFALAGWVRPGGLGGGDVKLAAVMGLLFGFPNVLWALLIGGSLGAIVAVLLIAGKWGTKSMIIPYAPFLCIGAVSALVYSPIPAFLRA